MNGSTNATDQSRILDFLSRVDRRLRVNEALKGLTLGLWGLSFVLVLSKLTGAWDRPVAGAALLLLYVAGAAALTVWFYSKRKGLFVPASVADSRSDSKDALKSSLDFIGLPERTSWMDFQIRRTASVAEGIVPADVAPTELPKPIFFATGLALVLAGLLSWNPRWLENVDPASWLAAAGIAPDEATSEAGAEAAVLPEEEKEALDELDAALERLREAELQMPETLRDLREVQDALAASRLEMDQLEMDLEKMGAELQSASGLTELAEALKAQDAQKAAELLRALAERLSEAQTSEELKALLESLKNADVQQADLKNLMEQLENAQSNMSPESLAEMAQALEQAASQLESMGQQMAQPLDQMGQEMQSLQASMGQQQQAAGQEAQQGQQQQAGGQAMQSASGMMSSQLQMAQFQGDPSSAVPVDAGPAGDSTGPGGGEGPVLGEATTLDVQLEMEVLAAEERNEPIPEEIFERLSREEKSTLNYEAVSQRKSYAEESVLRHERVPWSYRSLVKTYFLTIVRNAEEKSESGSQK